MFLNQVNHQRRAAAHQQRLKIEALERKRQQAKEDRLRAKVRKLVEEKI